MELIAPERGHRHQALLAVDGSEHSLETARRLSWMLQEENTEIILLYVQKLPVFSTEDTWEDPETKRQRNLKGRIEAERIFASVNAVLARGGLTSHLQLMLEGHPPEQILKYAEEAGVDLIAMGSHGLSGVLSALMGSVSRKVLDHAKCPVLIVRLPEAEYAREGFLEA